MMTWRSFVGLVLVLAIGGVAGTLGQITRRNLGLHFARNLAHFTGQNLWFFAITVSPLALVFALEFTSPLWTMVLAAIFLGERLTRIKVLAGRWASRASCWSCSRAPRPCRRAWSRRRWRRSCSPPRRSSPRS
jgi:drug/metabolite transporter (DMT)-like permease